MIMNDHLVLDNQLGGSSLGKTSFLSEGVMASFFQLDTS